MFYTSNYKTDTSLLLGITENSSNGKKKSVVRIFLLQ
ncbi:hypothetical protein GBF38_010446, partial [Nibea albiflora]